MIEVASKRKMGEGGWKRVYEMIEAASKGEMEERGGRSEEEREELKSLSKES